MENELYFVDYANLEHKHKYIKTRRELERLTSVVQHVPLGISEVV